MKNILILLVLFTFLISDLKSESKNVAYERKTCSCCARMTSQPVLPVGYATHTPSRSNQRESEGWRFRSGKNLELRPLMEAAEFVNKKRKPRRKGLTVDRELANCSLHILSSVTRSIISGDVHHVELFLFFYLLLPPGAGRLGSVRAYRFVQAEHGPGDEAVELQ